MIDVVEISNLAHTKTCTHIFGVTKSNSLAKLVGIQA
jgi:hypothetical protein